VKTGIRLKVWKTKPIFFRRTAAARDGRSCPVKGLNSRRAVAGGRRAGRGADQDFDFRRALLSFRLLVGSEPKGHPHLSR
jgi:hypothetical protein